jgi:hypothetical protein
VEQLQERKEKLEKANAKLQVDIDYMASHSVLLEKKRKQELGCLKERYHKKFEVREFASSWLFQNISTLRTEYVF